MNQKQIDRCSKIIGWIIGIVGVSALMGWWLQWILESITLKDISFWLSFGFWLLVSLCVSDKIKPWIFAAMVIATGYVWFFV